MDRYLSRIDTQARDLPQQHRFFIWGVIAGFLFLAVYLGMKVGQGAYQMPMLVCAAMCGTAVGLWMGPKLWLLVPLGMCFEIPALPIGGRSIELTELAVAGAALGILVRFFTREEKIRIFRPESTGILLYIAWVGLIWALNPVGLAMLGSETVGLRFYIKLLIAFTGYIIISSRTLTTWDCRQIIRMWIAGAYISFAVGLVLYYVQGPPQFMDAVGPEDNFYTWHQSLVKPAFATLTYIFCRFRFSEIVDLRRWYLPVVIAGCYAMGFLSGKRAGLAFLLLLPFLVFAARKEVLGLVISGVLGILAVGILVSAQGRFIALPLTVQRALSYLPGEWDRQISQMSHGGSLDPFRTQMNELAWGQIQENPIIGKGFGIDVKKFVRIIQSTDNFSYRNIVALAMGSSWHNTWLGIWADFGFPAIIFWGIYVVQSLVLSRKQLRSTTRNQPEHVLAGMITLTFVFKLLTSYTGGHSAMTPLEQWWMYGIIVALVGAQRANQKRSGQKPAHRNAWELRT